MFNVKQIVFKTGRKLFKNVVKSKCWRSFSSTNPNFIRFVQFSSQEKSQNLGIMMNETEIVSLNDGDNNFPNNLLEFLEYQDELFGDVLRLVQERSRTRDLRYVRLLPPVSKPDKVICVGLNYKGHCDEQNKPYPQQPFFFSKFPSTIVGPEDDITHPQNSKAGNIPSSTAVDWEVELAVVIGRKARNVKIEDAYRHVFGYTIAQDISARDWQTPKRNNGQWLMAKSMDHFCPLGPAVVTKDEIHDPHALDISCSINGVSKQNANTGELIHRVDKLISYLSEFFTLLPGDVILTGTPSGVGVFRNPREFLKPGDVILSEISSLGKLQNRMV